MAKIAPWHLVDQTVHHNNNFCKTGNSHRLHKNQKSNLRSGKGGKPLCQECFFLSS